MELVPQHPEVGSLVPEDNTPTPQPLNPEDDLYRYFLSLVERHDKLDESQWQSIKRNWVKARAYFDGRQYGYVNTQTNQFVDYQKMPGETTYIDNTYQWNIQASMMELSRGSTELNFSYIGRDSYKGDLISAIAEQRYLTHKRRLFTSSRQDQENLSLLLYGCAFRYTYFDWSQHNKAPKVSVTDASQPVTATVCANCGVPSKGDCQRCGSDEVEEIQAGFQSKSIEYDDTPCGENNWESVDPMGLKFLLSAPTVKDSPYWIWEKNVLKDILQAKYPDVRITEDGETDKQNLDTSTPNIQGLTGGSQANSKFKQAWFDVDVYGSVRIGKDTKLRNGQVLKADTTLKDAFPLGIYIALNGKTILDVWNEDKNCKWTGVPYVTRLGTMIGAGTSIGLDAQDRKNDLVNLHMASVMNDSFRRGFVNENVIDPDSIPNDPRDWGIVKDLPGNGRIVGNGIDVLPGSSLTPDAYALSDKADQSMQAGMGTFSGGNIGAPDLQAIKNTATAYIAYRQTQLGRYAPMLAARADSLDKEQAYQFLENDQKYLTPEQWKKIAGDYGSDAVKAFLDCDLREELVIEVVGESYMPQASSDRQAKVMALGEAAGQFEGDLSTEAVAYLADAFDVPKYIVSGSVIRDTTYSAIGKLKVVADQIIQGIGQDVPNSDISDPNSKVVQLAQLVISESGVEVTPSLENHQGVIESLKDWWLTDMGRSATNLLKASVALYENQQELAIVADQQKKMQYAGMIAPPQPPKLIETLAYKDAPADIQRQIEARAGLQPSQMATTDQMNAQTQQAKVEQENQRTQLEAQKTRVQAADTVLKHATNMHKNELDAQRNKQVPQQMAA